MSPVEPSKRSRKVGYEVTKSSKGQIANDQNTDLAGISENGSLETVRDILFGAQSREFESRCDLLEQRMMKENAALQEKLNRALEDLKGIVQKQCLLLSRQLEEERSQRSDAHGELKRFLEGLEAQTEQSLTRVDKETNRQFETLQHHLKQQRKELDEQSQQAMASLEEQFQLAIQGLKDEKTDRGALAEMLMDVGLRLKVGSRDPETP